MAHRLSVICDGCGHEEHFAGRYTDLTPCIDNLISKEGWQRVTYTVGEPGFEAEYTTTELYCNNCNLTPCTHRTPREADEHDVLEQITYAARYGSNVAVGYDLIDWLYDLHEQKEAPSAAD